MYSVLSCASCFVGSMRLSRSEQIDHRRVPACDLSSSTSCAVSISRLIADSTRRVPRPFATSAWIKRALVYRIYMNIRATGRLTDTRDFKRLISWRRTSTLSYANRSSIKRYSRACRNTLLLIAHACTAHYVMVTSRVPDCVRVYIHLRRCISGRTATDCTCRVCLLKAANTRGTLCSKAD